MALMADYFTVGFMMNAVESSQRGGVKQSLRRLTWLLDVLIEHSDKIPAKA